MEFSFILTQIKKTGESLQGRGPGELLVKAQRPMLFWPQNSPIKLLHNRARVDKYKILIEFYHTGRACV